MDGLLYDLLADQDEYPATMAIHARCISMRM